MIKKTHIFKLSSKARRYKKFIDIFGPDVNMSKDETINDNTERKVGAMCLGI